MFGSSQGLSFGAGGYTPAASQDANTTPEKRTRQEDKQTCMPLTVRLLSDAVANRVDDGTELRIHGEELANCVLVGAVEGLVQQATGLEFVLNDSSGRIKVRHYRNGEADADMKGIEAGRYVSIVGSLRTTPMLHVSAMSLRPVTGADEVSYHTIEVAHAALKLKNGGSRAPDAITTPAKISATPAAPMDTLSPPKDAVPPSAPVQATSAPRPPATPMTTLEPLKGDALKDAVLQLFKTEGEGKEAGLSVSSVIGHFKASSPESIRGIVEQLVTDGEVYSTIDDEHFSCV